MIVPVTVVVPAYNCGAYIRAALDSVLAQAWRPAEIVVVDDGSTDDTAGIVTAYQGVVYLRQANGGPARARNVGIERSGSEYVAFLDADDLWLPGKLELQVRTLRRCPEVGFGFSTVWNFSDRDDVQVPDAPYSPPVLERWLARHPATMGAAVGDAYPLLLSANCVATSSVIVRRSAFGTVGMFDPELRGPEDYDLWLRLARRFPAAVFPGPTSRYRVQQAGLSGSWTNRSDVFHRFSVQVLSRHLAAYPSQAARAALGREYATYAYFQLALGRRDEAARLAIRGLLRWPTVRAARVYAEARRPRLYAALARAARGVARSRHAP